MIREAPTSSSSESIFTDPDSQYDENKTLNLVVTKLEQLNLVSTQPNLRVVHHESVNLSGDSESDEMPIKKKAQQNNENNGSDKGIFSVSRVKKVELAEIPLASDICATRKHLSSVKSSRINVKKRFCFLTFFACRCMTFCQVALCSFNDFIKI